MPLRTALASADLVEVLHEDQKSGAAAISYSGLLEDLVSYHWDQIHNLVAKPLVVDKAIDEAANQDKMPETKK
ncbi:MAG: hypothetical protein KDB63_07455 [Nocardioidaceae bacterium]|nr:hypothetical protein [Nocardioidaceae bacterium]